MFALSRLLIIIPVLLLLTITNRLQDDNTTAFGWTYSNNSWWFADLRGEPAGYMGVTVTYPDTVEAGKDLDVAVTFEYIANDQASSDYVIFSNVRIHLSDTADRESAEDLEEYAIVSSENYTFPLLKPGERHSHIFSIHIPESSEPVGTVEVAAPNSSFTSNESQPVLVSNNDYALDWSFSAFFSRGAHLQVHQWDSSTYYYEGKITPEELPPITIINPGESQHRNLVVRLQEPYSRIVPVNATIDGDKQYPIEPNGTKLSFQSNTVHTVEIPQFIAFPSNNNVRAAFVNWSDGSYHKISEDYADNSNSTIVREVNLTKDVELFAIYKTQYYLDVVSNFDDSPDGEGWYDSGSTAYFSVEPMSAMLTLNTFDRWGGDFSGNNPYASTDMNNPKVVTAHWKFDLALLGATTGAILSVVSFVKLFPPLVSRFRKNNNEQKNKNESNDAPQ
jgi:hypothetical protein